MKNDLKIESLKLKRTVKTKKGGFIITKPFYFCPQCGKTARVKRNLDYTEYLECLHCDFIAGLK